MTGAIPFSQFLLSAQGHICLPVVFLNGLPLSVVLQSAVYAQPSVGLTSESFDPLLLLTGLISQFVPGLPYLVLFQSRIGHPCFPEQSL